MSIEFLRKFLRHKRLILSVRMAFWISFIPLISIISQLASQRPDWWLYVVMRMGALVLVACGVEFWASVVDRQAQLERLFTIIEELHRFAVAAPPSRLNRVDIRAGDWLSFHYNKWVAHTPAPPKNAHYEVLLVDERVERSMVRRVGSENSFSLAFLITSFHYHPASLWWHFRNGVKKPVHLVKLDDRLVFLGGTRADPSTPQPPVPE